MDEPERAEYVCRLCDDNSEKMFSIFDKNEEGIETLQLIKECLQIIIYRTDPLSKQICESCLESLDTLSKFRRNAEEIAEKQRDKLRTSDEANTRVVQLFLQCGDVTDDSSELKDASTSTDDLPLSVCGRARRDVANGEVELCAAELHRQQAMGGDEKSLRKRKVVPFYHELDDSMCSSLTEYNTEGSQGMEEEASDVDSDDSDEARRPSKRRRLESDASDGDAGDGSPRDVASAETGSTSRGGLMVRDPDAINGDADVYGVGGRFDDEEEFRYQPLTLLALTLNRINAAILPGHQPDWFALETVRPECASCGAPFRNYKALAVHEARHLDVEVGDKIDHPVPWEASREDAEVRNKWLSYFDENGYEDDDIVIDDVVDVVEDDATTDATTADAADDLLIPVAAEQRPRDTSTATDASAASKPRLPPSDGDAGDPTAVPKLTGEEKIVLVGTQPTVNDIYLGDYAKDDRKLLYQSMRIQGVNKKFCTLCRYTFKDNWAIESHYFSLACFYTCRYCGMRFNKQRHKFEEHVGEHETEHHPVSEKIYAASKLSNIIPKVLHPPKPRRIVVTQHNPSPEMFVAGGGGGGGGGQGVPSQFNAQGKMRSHMERRTLQPNLQIKEEPQDSKDFITSQSKSGNQAYFCRKCYKVFFKLDEFNIHSKNCDFHQFPARNSGGRPSFGTPKNGEVSPAGRPMRNCTKEIGPYKDEVYLPDSIMREKEPRQPHTPGQSFVCFICNTPFPTIYSRNSHMRIHKGEMQLGSGQQQQQQLGLPPFKTRPPQPNQNSHATQNYRSPSHHHHHQQQQQQLHHHLNSMEVMIKQEPMDHAMEPMVEIHEPDQSTSFPESLGDGAVSITPISKNPRQRPSITPSVMKLVQSNPQLSIKKPPEKVPQQQQQPPMPPLAGGSSHAAMAMGLGMIFPDPDRTYKCSSCWEAFANKSHLYFHKKNQCEGSRLPCPFCKKRFGTEAEYSSHIYYSHPE